VEEEGIALLTFTVERNYAGWRLDEYLKQKIRRATMERVREIIVNDVVFERELTAATAVWPGLTFQVRRRVRAEPSVPPAELIEEVFIDDALLLVNKPAGLPIHPTARYHHNTLVEMLKVRYGFPAFPAHRLDRETSGLVVLARTLEASQRLMKRFANGEVKKQYLAIVEGWPQDEFTVDAPIAEGTELIRIAVRIDASGKAARTRFVVEKRFERGGEKFAVLRCFPETGRQHQIRVHLKHVGFPLVGDKMYGPDPMFFDRFSKHQLEPEAMLKLRLPRQALHAAVLEFTHPMTGVPVRFDAPLSADLRDFIEGRG